MDGTVPGWLEQQKANKKKVEEEEEEGKEELDCEGTDECSPVTTALHRLNATRNSLRSRQRIAYSMCLCV